MDVMDVDLIKMAAFKWLKGPVEIKRVLCKTKSVKYYTLHFACVVVHYSDEISNRQFILDFTKIVDFIDEIEVFINPIQLSLDGKTVRT